VLQRYCTQVRANQNLLKVLSYTFRTEDKTNSMYGIPEPVEQFSEVDIEKSKCNRAEQLDLFNHLCTSIPNTNEQESIFKEITETILTGTGCLSRVPKSVLKCTYCSKTLASQ